MTSVISQNVSFKICYELATYLVEGDFHMDILIRKNFLFWRLLTIFILDNIIININSRTTTPSKS